MQLSRQVAVRTVRTDEARDSYGAAVSEELGNFGNATDVLFAVLGAEAEVLVQAEADVVTVEAVGGEVVGVTDEGLL